MVERNNTSVAAVAIVLLVLVGLFAFFMVYQGRNAEIDRDLEVEIDDPLQRGE
jgi:hypothetical protein